MADIKNLFNTYINERNQINVANKEQEKAVNTLGEIENLLIDPNWQQDPADIENILQTFIYQDFESNFVELFNDVSQNPNLKEFGEELSKLNDEELNEFKEEFFNDRKKIILDYLDNSKNINSNYFNNSLKPFVEKLAKTNDLSQNSISAIKTSLSAIAVQTQTISQPVQQPTVQQNNQNITQLNSTIGQTGQSAPPQPMHQNNQIVNNDPFYLPPSTIIEETRLIRNMDALEKKEEATKEYEEASNKKFNELNLKTQDLEKDIQEKNVALKEVNDEMKSTTNLMKDLKQNNIELEKTNLKHKQKLSEMNVLERLFSKTARDYKKSIKENQELMKENVNNYNGAEKKLEVLKDVNKDKSKSLELSKKNQQNNEELIKNYKNIKDMNDKITKNTQIMKGLIPEIDAYNSKIKELTKELSENINARNKNLKSDPVQEAAILKLKEELNGFKNEYKQLTNKYEEMENEIKSATNSIKLATKNIDNVYISTKEMIKARDTSNKVTEKTKEVLAQAKGLCLNLIGMAVSIALPTLGNIIKDIGENTKNKANLHYQAWKENKATIQEMKGGLQEMKAEKKELKQQNKAIDKSGISLTI